MGGEVFSQQMPTTGVHEEPQGPHGSCQLTLTDARASLWLCRHVGDCSTAGPTSPDLSCTNDLKTQTEAACMFSPCSLRGKVIVKTTTLGLLQLHEKINTESTFFQSVSDVIHPTIDSFIYSAIYTECLCPAILTYDSDRECKPTWPPRSSVIRGDEQ